MYAGQRGFEFEVTFVDEGDQPLDLSGATARKIVFVGPGGARFERDSAGTGDDGVLRYVTVPEDEFTPGRWRFQALATFAAPGSDAIGDVVPFTVLAKL